MKTISDIANELVGMELMCENCGTVLELFDDECAECGTETGFGVNGYYSSMREEAEEKYERLKSKRIKKIKEQNKWYQYHSQIL